MYIGEELSSLVGFLEWVTSNRGVGEVFVLLVLFFLAAYIHTSGILCSFVCIAYLSKKKKKKEIEKLQGYHCSLRQGV